jgi:hypothetical protein
MDHRAPKVARDLKAKAMAAAKVDATVLAAKNNVVIRVLTTAGTAKAGPRRVAHDPKAEAQVVALKVGKAVKIADTTTVTNCLATSIP